MQIHESYVPFRGYRTYCRVVEPDRPQLTAAGEPKPPLLLLHGGPGSSHNYLELLDPLADRDGRALVMYDQIGCGLSWDCSMADHPELWRAETWLEELENVVRTLGLGRFHLLGQSWGGMLAIAYLCERRPRGVASVTLSSTTASAQLWGAEGHRRLRYLDEAERRCILDAEARGDYSGEDFAAAIERYMELFCIGPVTEADPECIRRPRAGGRVPYVVAWGDNELMPTGTLASFDYTARLGEIRCPALVVSGEEDLCSPLVAKQLADGIPGARWELFANCRHMCYYDDNPRYLALLEEWLNEKD
jgi:proline iminopeptidase